MTTTNELLAVRIVTTDAAEFAETRDFYRRLLGREEDGGLGDGTSVHQAAFFRLSNVELIVTREQDATPEAKINKGNVWLCFRTDDPDSAFAAARARGLASRAARQRNRPRRLVRRHRRRGHRVRHPAPRDLAEAHRTLHWRLDVP